MLFQLSYLGLTREIAPNNKTPKPQNPKTPRVWLEGEILRGKLMVEKGDFLN